MSAATSRGRISAKCALVAAAALFAAGAAQAEAPDKFVEYIQSDGTQYINLGDVLSPNVNVTIDYQVTKANGDYYNIFGCVRKFAYITWDWFYVRGKRTVQTSLNLGHLKVNIDSSRQTISFNGKNQSLESTDSREGSDTSAEAYVFWGKGSSENKAIMKLWSCVISNGNEEVMALYPCVKGDKVGLFDVVSRQIFYKASGSKEFTYGSEVDPPPGYATEFVEVKGSPFPYGLPTPGYGRETNVTAYVSKLFTCPSVATNAAETIAATCTGYTLALTNGNVYAGTALSTSIVYSAETACSTLTWLWSEKFKPTIVSSGLATVAGSSADGWYAKGTSATFTATPNAGSTFVSWLVDGKKVDTSGAATLVLAMDAPHTVAVACDAEIYVSKTGNDANDGTASDDGHALLTVEAGVEKALAYVTENAVNKAVVNVGEGTFPFTTNVVLAARTTLKGAGRDKTVLDAFSLVKKGGSAVRITNSLSVVKSLTITNGVPSGVSAENKMRCFQMSAGRIEDCRLTGGKLGGYNFGKGAGAYVTGGLMTNCVIDHCSLADGECYGSGVSMTGGEIVGCEFFANRSPGSWNTGGSAISISGGWIHHCHIHDNGSDSTFEGGALHMGATYSGTYLVENCLIVNNKAKSGYPAVYQYRGGTIRYCTIAGNAPGVSGCVYIQADNSFGWVGFNNNIVWGNATGGNDVVIGSATYGTIKSNLFAAAVSSAPANYVGDPLFIDPDKGDYRLGARSSAAYGRALPIAAVTTDYALRTRDATAPSIGAYEYDPSAIVFGIRVTVTKDVALPGEATAFATVTGAEADEYEVEWFVDDVSVGKGLSITFPTATYGAHNVKAVVTTEDGRTKSDEVADAFTIRTDVAYVNNTGTGTYPYATAATATNDLAAAVKAVWTKTSDPRVIIEPGTYSIANTVSLDAPMRVIGPGADKAEFVSDRSWANGISLSIKNAKASVSGITISSHGTKLFDGKRKDGRPLYMNNGEIRDCVISNFYNCVFNAAGIVWMEGGKMTSCKVIDCRLRENESRGGGIFMTGGTVSNCLVRGCACYRLSNDESGNGIHTRGGSVINTRIVDCGVKGWSQDGALVVKGATVRGCVIENAAVNATSYSAVRIDSGTFESSTVVGNAGWKAAVNVNKGTVRNVVAHGNDTTTQLTNVSGKVTYCCYDEATEGESGNRVAAGRLFRGVAKGCYYPLKASPCYNCGTNLDWMSGACDLKGNPRILHKTVDIGAFESDPKGLSLIVR